VSNTDTNTFNTTGEQIMTELTGNQTATHSIRVTPEFDAELKPRYRFTHFIYSDSHYVWVPVSDEQVVENRGDIDDWLRNIGLIQVGRYLPISYNSNTYEADLMEMS
jgi:hypothetical protein